MTFQMIWGIKFGLFSWSLSTCFIWTGQEVQVFRVVIFSFVRLVVCVDSDSEKAAESWKRYVRRDDSKIVDLFVGQLKSTLQCTVCGHCSVTFDPFWDLSLPIPPSSKSNVKLQHCLDLFGKEEILDGDEKPVRTRHLDISIPAFHLLGLSNFTYFFFTIVQTCSKCQTRRKCTKKFTIHKFPQILVLRKFSVTFSKFFPAWIFDQFALIHSLFNCPGRFETLQSRREIPQIRRQRRFPADGPGLVCLYKSRHQTIALQLSTLRSHQSFGIGLFGTLHGLLPASIQCELARIQRL